MAASQAVIEWNSKDAATLRSLQAIERGMQNIAKEQEKLRRSSERSTQEFVSGTDRWTSGLRNVAGALVGAGGIAAAYDLVREANRKAIQEAEDAGRRYESIFRKLRVQGGLNEVQGAQAQQRILGIAAKNAVSAEVAVGGAMGLVGANFSVAEATGPSLQALLRARAATNATGGTAENLEEIAGNAAGYLTSQGKALTAENLNKLLMGGFALRQTGKFELSDLSSLGIHGAAFRGRLTQEEQLAAFGTLMDQNLPGPEAGTALRNIVMRLATARTGRTSARALQEIGLKPEDVDLVGESLMDAMGRIEGGLSKIPEANRASVLKLLFEEAGVAPATALMRERTGRYADYTKAIAGVGTQYGEAVRVAQSGRGAAEARLEVQHAARAAASDAGDDLVMKALAEQGAAEGLSPFGRSVDAFVYSSMRNMRFSQAAALGFVGEHKPYPWSLDTGFARRVLSRVEAAAAGDVPPMMERAAVIQMEQRMRDEEQRKATERQRAQEAVQRSAADVFNATDEGGYGGFTIGPRRLRTRGWGQVTGRAKPVEVRVVNPQTPIEQRERVTPSAALGR